MGALLKPLIIWILGSALARVLVALGISITTYKGLDALLNAAFAQIHGLVGGMSADLLAILSRFGLFTAMSIIASAMMTVASIKMLKAFAGVKQ